MYFFFLPVRHWLHFGWLVVTCQHEKFKTVSIFFNVLLYQVNDGKISWCIFISSVVLHFTYYKRFRYVFNSFVQKIFKSVLKFYNWLSRERKTLKKLAASQECWSLQTWHCNFGHHHHQNLLMMKYIKNQWSSSLTTLSKGSKWSRIWKMPVTLKLSPNIAFFNSVFIKKIRRFLDNYKVKPFFCHFLLI